MEQYFEGEMPSTEELDRAAGRGRSPAGRSRRSSASRPRRASASTSCSTCSRNAALPPTAVPRTAAKDGDTVTLKPDPAAPLAAQVFKTRIDPFVQRLSFIRIYSGTLKKDATLAVARPSQGHQDRPTPLGAGGQDEPVDEAGPGDIVAVAKSEELHTGTSLGDVELPPLKFPTPMVGLAVTPKTRGDEAKLSGALHKITEEDRTVHLEHDAETKEMVLTGMSELHLHAAPRTAQAPRQGRDRNTRAEDSLPRNDPDRTPRAATATRSSPAARASSAKSTSACTRSPKAPTPEDFATKERFPQLKNVALPREEQLPVGRHGRGRHDPRQLHAGDRKGLPGADRQRASIAGYPVQNICVEVYFGKDHPVDSNETAFRIAARQAFAERLQAGQAEPAWSRS